jgi:hypothetical protein
MASSCGLPSGTPSLPVPQSPHPDPNPQPPQVYEELEPTANFLHLSAGGRGLSAAWAAIMHLDAAVAVASWYYALSGINILLLLAR